MMPDIYNSPWSIHLPSEWLLPLATSDLRAMVYKLRPVYGVMRFLHLLGMAGFLGMIMLVEVKRLGFFPEANMREARSPIIALMNGMFALTIISGVALFLYDPIGVGLHTMFVPKLILTTLGLIHAHWIQRTSAVKDSATLKKITAGIALMIWILVIGCSTWNHVEQPLNPGAIHRNDPAYK